jgi:hypothetical protein
MVFLPRNMEFPFFSIGQMDADGTRRVLVPSISHFQGKRRHIMRQLVLGPRNPWVLEGQTSPSRHTKKVVLYEEDKGRSQMCLFVKAIVKVYL